MSLDLAPIVYQPSLLSSLRVAPIWIKSRPSSTSHWTSTLSPVRTFWRHTRPLPLRAIEMRDVLGLLQRSASNSVTSPHQCFQSSIARSKMTSWPRASPIKFWRQTSALITWEKTCLVKVLTSPSRWVRTCNNCMLATVRSQKNVNPPIMWTRSQLSQRNAPSYVIWFTVWASSRLICKSHQSQLRRTSLNCKRNLKESLKSWWKKWKHSLHLF